MDITAQIKQKLCEIETAEKVRIIYSAESGSRAWGFASPDSDYDVRFIYLRRPEDYLRLGKIRDVIEWQLDDVYDINGWDVQKALRLLRGSNPALFEWAGSPIVYRTSPEWERVSGLFGECFLAPAALRHYLSIAKNDYHVILCSEKVKLKKYFYVMRAILAARWVADKMTPPPVPFSELVSALLDPQLVPIVQELVQRKAVTGELGQGEHIPALDDYIARRLEELSAAADKIKLYQKKDWQLLDAAFLELLRTWENSL